MSENFLFPPISCKHCLQCVLRQLLTHTGVVIVIALFLSCQTRDIGITKLVRFVFCSNTHFILLLSTDNRKRKQS